jgi:hypothetical protein
MLAGAFLEELGDVKWLTNNNCECGLYVSASAIVFACLIPTAFALMAR